ncbi:MAG: hypothetical protein JF887_03135 [Candidatus Dormibacteraeota bacterium]|uniref:Uncharacterized protein n=1 Tax=Candidatus Amunia macphersoniae TaxID=3127014 RepID=A0A934KBJ5_9BACT|nr:hypothetical protein [Candidatus Dormibacteraeota bacterium]
MSEQNGEHVLARRIAGLRTNAFAALVMLLIQLVLGMWVNLFATIPSADGGTGFLSAFFRAISNGPVGLSVHAILGALPLVSATAAVVRAVVLHRGVLIGIASLALLAIAIAFVTGDRYVATSNASASWVMALCTAVPLFCYALILFTVASVRDALAA